MITKQAHIENREFIVLAKVKDYAVLAKTRLASLVVFSALIGYLLAADGISWIKIFALIIGGFLVTGSSNAINQIIEKDLDKLMARTKNRPLPDNRLSVTEATIVAGFMGVIGLFVLFYFLNPLSGWLGLLSLVLYTALYTPLKRITPFAVLVGAIPGAIPPMLGWIAETGKFGFIPGILFLIQFMWQFPHFWAIAWKLDDDYSKAGFKLLPSPGGKDKASAFQILIYTLFLIPISLFTVFYNISGYFAGIVVFLAGIWFLFKAYKVYSSCSDEQATKLMFASFIYLPIILFAYIFDKI